MALQCGIVGLPNVGKSTLFNALTAAKAESANYPFCTIDPNVGVVSVPDPRLETISKLVSSQKVIPTTIEFVDIAGLVEGASRGEGLGNQFLANIRETDAIVHVVRCFDDDNIVHVSGNVDPIRDIEVIDTELALADLETVKKRREKLQKQSKAGASATLKEELLLTDKIYETLDQGNPVRSIDLSEDEARLIKGFHLLTSKPVLYVCNVAESDLKEGNSWTREVAQKAQSEKHKSLILCGALEAEIAQVPETERQDFLEAMGGSEPGLHRLIREAYNLLGLATFFTAGEKETRAWTIHRGWRAPQAAGVIHSDFEKGFIRAETYRYEDLVEKGSELGVREAGLYRSEGKDYVVKDGDIILFRFNT